jgi:hypothetical protein
MNIEIINDCECEHDLHEIKKYPRKGLTVQSFKIGEKLEFKKEWSNFFGSFYRVKTEKGYADISKKNAKYI